MLDEDSTDSIQAKPLTRTNKSAVPAFESRWALFLDIDGTLVDFEEHPDESRVTGEIIETLRELHRWTNGALALVSGRSITTADVMFEPLRLPIAGLHGHERRDALGRTRSAPLEDVERELLATARARLNQFADEHLSTFVEEKGASIALHYRRAPDAADDVENFAAELEAELPDPMCLQRGKMVVEIRSSKHDKGSAIEAFMNELPFENRTPVFIGDDATDEYGFRWVNEHDGLSIKVGSGASEAQFRIETVKQVADWLEDYVRYYRQRHDEAGNAV